jgi:hypothetical protein
VIQRPGWLARSSSFTTARRIQKGQGVTVEEGRPATAALELCAALVKGRIASRAGIDSCCLVMLVLPRPSSLGAFQAEHPELRALSIKRSRMHTSDPVADAPARE